MKTLLKLFLGLLVFLVLLVGIGLFVLTRPGVQKKVIEGRLPEGSSIGTVRVTTGSLELSELKLALPDGTKVRLAMLDTDFKPLDAVFKRTIKMGALNVEGLVVDIPQALIQGASPSTPAPELPGTSTQPATEGDTSPAPVEPSAPSEFGSPMDALYAIGQIDWLIDIDSIRLDGELRDAAGSNYAIDLRSGAIRPGQETTIEASLKLRAGEALQAGLQTFDADAQCFLKQNSDGGFEQLRVESLTQASDAAGQKLLTINQDLDLASESFDERASLKLAFDIDLSRPEVFLPEMAGVGALNVQGSLQADADGEVLTLSKTDLLLSAAGAEKLSVKLNKTFALGGETEFSGNLMDLRVTSLPLAWTAPWLPDGLALAGNDLSAQFNLTGLPGVALELRSTAPLQVGPLSLTQDGVLLLNQVTLNMQPILRYGADKSITWDLGDFQVTDRFGEILSGTSKGRLDDAAPGNALLPSGLQTKTKLNVGLQEVTQQPALAGYTSILSGRASLDINLDPKEKYPLFVQGRISGISPRAYPGQRQDYRFALQLTEPNEGVLGLGANLEAGSESRPTTSLQFKGQVRPNSEPLKFTADLTSHRISQGDIEMLRAAFQAPAQAVAKPPRRPATPAVPYSTTPRPPAPPVVSDSSTPPWSGYDGAVNLSVGELYLLSGKVINDLQVKAVVNESLLSLRDLKGAFEGGIVSGNAEVRFSSRQRMAYAIQTDAKFDNFDPVMFASKPSGSFPVQGTFNGEAHFEGRGATLEEAADAIEGDLLLTGREGILTAFELDTRSNLGLIGAGLLGQQLNRPGITALAQAVPYFENMPFSDFTLKISRGADKSIMIPQLQFVGRNLLINGSGSVQATSLKNAMSQPLDMTLELGAKGKLIEYLETLGLLGPNTAEDGFRRWARTLQIKGTLADPDTSALERILKEAAHRALREPPKKQEEPPADGSESAEPAAGETPSEQNLKPKPTKEEKIIRDVETGLDILKSVLGS